MLKRLTPHICMILSLIMLAFFILDRFNPGMNFLGNDIFKSLLLIYGVVSLVTSWFLIAHNRKNN